MGNGSRMDVECLESLLDRPAIRAPFIFAYIAVFLICLIGNSFTIVVICAHRSMRTATNFFLANLAVADLLVAIFCVLQNMFQLVGMSNGHWPLGETFCRLYAFVIHLVPCTGIGILVCISVEKYIAVLHPLLALKLLTPRFRSLMMASIWVISLLCNLPYYTTTVYRRWSTSIASCTRAHQIFSLISTRNMVTLSFVIWYCIPLCTIAFLYTRIGLVLWHSAPLKKLTHQQAAQSSEMSTVMSQTGGQQQEQRKRSLFGYRMSASAALTNGTAGTALAGSGGMANGTGNGTAESMANGGGGNRCSKRSHSQPSGGTGPLQTLPLIRVNRSGTMSSESGSGSHVEDEDADDEEEMISREKKRGATYAAGENGTAQQQQQHSPMSTTANGQQKNSLPSAGGGSAVVVTTMESRKKIIRLLIAIVCSFSILTLPHHARLLHGVWSQHQMCIGGFEALYQPISYLLLFLSSSCNPFLYAFMSQRFRSAIRDIFKCRRGRIRRKSTRTRTQNSDIVGCAISTGGEGLSRCSSLTRLNNSGTQQNGHNHLANGGATRLTTVASERNLTMPNGGEQQQQQQQKAASNGGTNNNNHLKPFMSSPMNGQKNGRSGSGGSGSTASSLVYATQRSNGSIQMAVVYRKCA